MDLTTTELAVLGLAAGGEASGYDLSQRAGRSTGFMWSPSRSQIYKVLPRLVADGYATSREVEQQGRPDKALYSITPAGRTALRRWVEHVEEGPAASGGNVFLLKVFFGWAAPPEATLRQLEAYRRLLLARVSQWEKTKAGLDVSEPLHSTLALEHGLVRARATLAWLDQAEARLRDASSMRRPRRRARQLKPRR